MTLSSPWLLVLGLLLVMGVAAGVLVLSRQRTRVLAGAGLSIGRRRQPGRWFVLSGIVVLAVATAGPLVTLPVGRAAGTVIVAIDTSNSMAAADVEPTRLQVAQQAAIAFIDAQPDTVDIGVVAFNQGALATSLPNSDHSVAVAAVQGLQVAGGTSLASAILAALAAITGETVAIGEDGTIPDLGYWGSATIVLFSDGEDRAQQDGLEQAATAAQNAGIHIDTVGVGTAAGTTVQVDDYQVHTALDAELLAAVAQVAGGSYHPVSAAAELDDVAAAIDLRLTVSDEEVPIAGGFIGLALLLLGIGTVLTVLRTGRWI